MPKLSLRLLGDTTIKVTDLICLLWKKVFFFAFLPGKKLLPSTFTSRWGMNILIASESPSCTWQGAVDAFKLVLSFHLGRVNKKALSRHAVFEALVFGAHFFFIKHSQLKAGDVEDITPRRSVSWSEKTDWKLIFLSIAVRPQTLTSACET